MEETRKFSVGDLVEAKHGDSDDYITDGVIASVHNPGEMVPGISTEMYSYYIVHACDPERGDIFTEEEVKTRAEDDAWRAGHYYLGDQVKVDNGTSSFVGVITKFRADADRPYVVYGLGPLQFGSFGHSQLTLKDRIYNSERKRLQIGDWVVADDGEVRFVDAVIGYRPIVEGGSFAIPGGHFVYAADGSGDIREFREEHLRPRVTPVPPEFHDPHGIAPDWEWVHEAPLRARRKAIEESSRHLPEALPDEPSPLRYIKNEPPKRPIVSGFRGVLMWIVAVPLVSFAAEALAPGVGGGVSLVLVVGSLGVVPWIAGRIHD